MIQVKEAVLSGGDYGRRHDSCQGGRPIMAEIVAGDLTEVEEVALDADREWRHD